MIDIIILHNNRLASSSIMTCSVRPSSRQLVYTKEPTETRLDSVDSFMVFQAWVDVTSNTYSPHLFKAFPLNFPGDQRSYSSQNGC